MSNLKGRPIAVPEVKKTEFKKLTQVPEYSWPAILLAVICFSAVFIFDYLALTGSMSLILACLFVSFIYYWFFSIIHDGAHRSISKNKKLNDFIAQSAVSIFAPYAAIDLLRWAHMEHHRFTNDESKDPDIWVHGTWWSMPLRWMVIDFYYGYRLLTNGSTQSKTVIKDSLPYIVIGTSCIIGLIVSGYGFEYLVLSFLPSRLAFVGIGYTFFWLPHAHWPDPEQELRQSENYTLATTVRTGNEWLLNPLLQYQNYHLIHHLWPTTPFYNNERVWKLLKPELEERDLAVTQGFTIQPKLIFAEQKTQ